MKAMGSVSRRAAALCALLLLTALLGALPPVREGVPVSYADTVPRAGDLYAVARVERGEPPALSAVDENRLRPSANCARREDDAPPPGLSALAAARRFFGRAPLRAKHPCLFDAARVRAQRAPPFRIL